MWKISRSGRSVVYTSECKALVGPAGRRGRAVADGMLAGSSGNRPCRGNLEESADREVLLKNEQMRFCAGACGRESEEGVLWKR